MNVDWYVNRLRAMSVAEIRWQLSQMWWKRTEVKAFAKQNKQITDKAFCLRKEEKDETRD